MVTGACGGLGAAVIEILVGRGCTVFAVDSNARDLGGRVLNASIPTSRFSAYLRRAVRALDRERTKSMDPAEVAAVVVRALHARKPRARYRVGNPPLRVMLGRLPAAWTDALIRWYC